MTVPQSAAGWQAETFVGLFPERWRHYFLLLKDMKERVNPEGKRSSCCFPLTFPFTTLTLQVRLTQLISVVREIQKSPSSWE